MTIKQTGGIFGRNPTFNDVDIDGDLTVAGDLTVQGTTITVDSATAQSIVLGDNDKMTFGDGPDLEIYSDGTTGQIAGNVNVTGTVTADGLTVDSGATSVTATIASLGNGATDTASIDIYRTNAGHNTVEIVDKRVADLDGGNLVIRTSDTLGTVRDRMLVSEDGDISFYDTSGTSQAFFWDASAERIGLGTTTPATDLHIVNSGAAQFLLQAGAADTAYLLMGDAADTNIGWIAYENANDAMSFRTNNAERMRIDSSGNVGIGVSSVSGVKMDVLATASDNLVARFENNHATGSYGISVKAGDDSGNYSADFANKSGTSLMRIRGDGNVGIGTSSPSANLHVSDDSGSAAVKISAFPSGNNDAKLILDGNGTGLCKIEADKSLTFSTDSGTTQHMTLDASGNLLVGKTAENTTTVGIQARADGLFAAVKSEAESAIFGRNTNDGDIVKFRKDGTTVGSISTLAGFTVIGSGDTGILFDATEDAVKPRNSSTASRDAAIDLGGSGDRFKDLYLSGGVYLGGAVAANKLDDYEEGTFTPVMADAASGGNTATSGSENGRYTKIGRMVHIYIVILGKTTTGLTSGNDLFIRDLPFTSVGTGNTYPQGAIKLDSITFNGYCTAQIFENANYLKICEIASGVAHDFITCGEVSSGANNEILIQMCYEASA